MATINYSEYAASSVTFSDKALDLMQRRHVSEEDMETFKQIMEKTAGETDSKQALRNLSAEEMEVVRKVHSLGGTINISELSDEGAANLLAAPGSEHDLNNDGLTAIGAGYMITFPPENASESFKQAWEKATEGQMGLLDVPTHMIFKGVLANIGKEPGDPDWVNPYANSDFDYGAEVSNIMDSLDYQYLMHWISLEQYQKNMQFYNKLQDAMAMTDNSVSVEKIA